MTSALLSLDGLLKKPGFPAVTTKCFTFILFLQVNGTPNKGFDISSCKYASLKFKFKTQIVYPTIVNTNCLP